MTTNTNHQVGGVLASDAAAGRWQAAAERASDYQLIDRIAVGDKLAMRVLYGRHSVHVFRFAARILHNETSADDIVNDVFLAVWRKAGSFGGHSQVSTWLLSIARHRAIEEHRRRMTGQIDDKAAELIEDTSDDPETATDKAEQNVILRECLTQLSPAHREMIDLIYYHGRSIRDVAAITAIPRNTVKTRMFYARKHLADLLRIRGITRAAH